MKILITGARGWLGEAVTEVVAAEHEVRAFDLAVPDIPVESTDAEVEIVPGFGDRLRRAPGRG